MSTDDGFPDLPARREVVVTRLWASQADLVAAGRRSAALGGTRHGGLAFAGALLSELAPKQRQTSAKTPPTAQEQTEIGSAVKISFEEDDLEVTDLNGELEDLVLESLAPLDPPVDASTPRIAPQPPSMSADGTVVDEMRPGGMLWFKRGLDEDYAHARRVVRTNVPDATLPDNSIRNTKYKWYTFPFESLKEQFSQHLNRYFLIIACLQLFSAITPVNPITTWGPLIVILSLTAYKEASDDIARYKRDKEFNERMVPKLSAGGQLVDCMSQDIRPGDIIRVNRNEELPCDVLLLKSSDPKGSAYVMTANLDGETDLKLKKAIASTQAMDLTALAAHNGALVCLPPNPDIHKFDSYYVQAAAMSSKAPGDLAACSAAGDKTALSINNAMWQATHCKNCDWILGMAMYTGMETRVGCNRKPAATKWCQVDNFINRCAIMIFIFQLSVAICFGVIGSMKNGEGGEYQKHYYLAWETETEWYEPFLIPLRYLLLMSYMIPLSMKVTLDFTKMYYAKLVDWDVDMFDTEQMVGARAASSAILEDLGQIGYVLTDKTGTLTQNVMRFRKSSINGVGYGAGVPVADDTELQKALSAAGPDDPVMTFFRSMALNHTAVPQMSAENVRFYSSASPDEEALVTAAKDAGAQLLTVTDEYMEVRVAGTQEKWDMLANLEFTSDRKRMSVIVKSASTGKIMLHMKGADDCMFARTRANDPLKKSTEEHVETYAAEGLRTLVIAQREMTPAEWETFSKKKIELDSVVTGRAEGLAKLYETVEHDLEITGATAIEDLLQDEVPETIALLRRANIRFWMLTGDKKSTAKTIGETCRLLQDEVLLDLEGADKSSVGESLNAAIGQAAGLKSAGTMYAIIVTGQTLKVLLDDFKALFAELSLSASAVICCRVTPQQKSDVVGIVKDTQALTLAIGDGGNDVSMIQKANVGVGILGKEGLQAARAADYSIAQFKFLKNLLLVHGRLAYHRTTFISQYCFFKSMTYALSQGLYNIYAGYSGTPLFNSMTALGFNSFFTGLGVWFYCFDIDLPTKRYCIEHPQFYWSGQQYKKANFPVILGFLARGVYQAALCAFGMVFLLWDATDENGYPITRATMGYAVFSAMLFGMTMQLALHSNSIATINWSVGLVGPFVFFGVIIGAYNVGSTTVEGHDVFNQSLGNGWFWLAVPIVSALAVLPTWLYFFTAQRFYPNDDEMILQMARELGEERAKEQNERRALPTTIPLPPSFGNVFKKVPPAPPTPGITMSA